MTRAFCTYFDHRYLPRALVMLRSLERTGVDPRLYVLCMDTEAEQLLTRLGLSRVTAIPLRQLEESDDALRHAKQDRTLIEYYFTCTPSLPLHILAIVPELRQITYVDADLYFLANPESLLQIADVADATIVPHRYPIDLAGDLLKYGKYNVGWLSFRRSTGGLEVLRWWRERCLEWCHDRVDGARYADQGYLDDWPQRFPGVAVIEHPGANLAPWNVARHRVEFGGGRLTADGADVIFYHVHGLKPELAGTYRTNLSTYGARLTPALRDGLYRPYIGELRAAQAAVDKLRPSTPTSWAGTDLRSAAPTNVVEVARRFVGALVRRDLLLPPLGPRRRS